MLNPYRFFDTDPTELILIPDHYIFRMLYSQGISPESLGIPARASIAASWPGRLPVILSPLTMRLAWPGD